LDDDVDDVDASDGDGDAQTDVTGIEVKVMDWSRDIGPPRTCCLINSRALRELLDSSDQVNHLARRLGMLESHFNLIYNSISLSRWAEYYFTLL